jgi:hypothetical protein
MLATDDINFKIQIQIRLQVQEFDYQLVLEVKKLFQLTVWQKWLIPRFTESVPFMRDKNNSGSVLFPSL